MDRYKLEIINNDGDQYIRCEPATDGSWVMFKDVSALQKRIAELEARADRNAAGYARVDAEARRAEFLHKQKIAALEAHIAELEAALATARRDAMEEAAKIAESEPELHDQMPAEFEKYSREILARASCIATKRAIAAAIRAALEGGKE